MKIVINRCYGGFGLSDKAQKEYCRQKGIQPTGLAEWEIERNDPFLVDVVEKLGEDANTKYSDLKVVNVPDEVDWVLEEYDGIEWIAERHRTWS